MQLRDSKALYPLTTSIQETVGGGGILLYKTSSNHELRPLINLNDQKKGLH